MVTREPKITFGEMRAMGVRGLTAFNRKASYNGSRPLLAATHLDQRSHVLDHVLGSRPEYLVAVARSDSVEGFLDVLFEVLHFNEVLNLDCFAGTHRGAVTRKLRCAGSRFGTSPNASATASRLACMVILAFPMGLSVDSPRVFSRRSVSTVNGQWCQTGTADG